MNSALRFTVIFAFSCLFAGIAFAAGTEISTWGQFLKDAHEAGFTPSEIILAVVVGWQQYRIWQRDKLFDKIVKKHIGINGDS